MLSEWDAMSRFSSEFRANASIPEIIRNGQTILEEMGLFLDAIDDRRLIFKEKPRFDPYNPARVEVNIREDLDGPVIEIEGENVGIGPYQESHVMRMIFEFMDRMEEELGSGQGPLDDADPQIGREIEILSNLHDRGILSDYEFQKAKDKILR